ncbi:DUF6559 family protein [Microbulbifer sp. TRSA001]|uniref:DUF6559 family protein n=1 Tax=Microbulbifer sp. TRSA001 TaxID=3243381 RepID=UPI004039CA6B
MYSVAVTTEHIVNGSSPDNFQYIVCLEGKWTGIQNFQGKALLCLSINPKSEFYGNEGFDRLPINLELDKFIRSLSPSGLTVLSMNRIKNLFYEFQYSKYVRGLPFYVVRHSGIKKSYSTKDIDRVIYKYGFNCRYSPIGYAILGNRKEYKSKAKFYAPHPSREYIRDRVSKKYFEGKDFELLELMKLSLFKFTAEGELFVDPNEYWEYLAEIEKQTAKSSSQ